MSAKTQGNSSHIVYDVGVITIYIVSWPTWVEGDPKVQ